MPDIDWGHSMAKELATRIMIDRADDSDWTSIGEWIWYDDQYDHMTRDEKELLRDLTADMIARATITITFD